MMFSACYAKTKSVDTEAAKIAVNIVMEKYLNAFNAKMEKLNKALE
jgi:hypothetical protein